MNNTLYSLARNSLYLLNRAYAQWSFLVNFALYSFLWIFLRGIPPSTSTRPSPSEQWHPGVFISDAQSPVGRETALLLARSGYTVFAGVSQLSDGRSLIDVFTSNSPLVRIPGGAIHSLLCTTTDKTSVHAAAAAVARSIDANPRTKLVAIVCLAQLQQIAPLEQMSDAAITESIHQNLLPHITLTRAFLPLLRQSSTQSRILLLTSAIGYTPLPGFTLTSATSASIDSFSRALTAELLLSKDSNNVRCTVIRYGSITTTAATLQRAYEEHLADPSSSGFDSTGHLMSSHPSASVAETTTNSKQRSSYVRLMRRWSRILYYERQLGSPPLHIAKQVKDALTDAWLQPCYTVGWDALLAQALRDFVPEPVYEWLLLKVFS
ncbi:hypothetical protein QFC21_001589 [Naganishia friedmannii]|uniref:Uncharacterized protein n=1 Tax=Naganishia friedmannii TaxID=89922 RepID=A0ACC2W4W2_9TREE|nr:hypothetical protein QFC21_001589 [Naganishia friedmannii]